MAQIAAASPTPDLSGYIAPPPGSDWIEQGPGRTVIEGSFTADDYGRYSTTINGTPSSAGENLTRLGFVGGFGREWEQRFTQNYLVERAFGFSDAEGATSWYNGVKTQSETAKAYQSDISVPASLPNSFGVVFKQPNGIRQWRVDFVYGNVVFVVHADATSDDMASVAVGQAKAMFDRATGVVQPTPVRAPTALAPPSLEPLAIGAAAAAFLIAVLILAVVLIVLRARRPAAAIVQAAPQISPDGAYWWDGATWRSTANEVPPNVQRSPDGAYWWDGARWRAVGGELTQRPG